MAGDFKRQFRAFVSLLEDMPQVRHVVGLDDEADIFVYVETRDEAILRSIFRAEKELRARYPSPEVDFHVRFLDGRPLDQFVAPLPSLVFSR